MGTKRHLPLNNLLFGVNHQFPSLKRKKKTYDFGCGRTLEDLAHPPRLDEECSEHEAEADGKQPRARLKSRDNRLNSPHRCFGNRIKSLFSVPVSHTTHNGARNQLKRSQTTELGQHILFTEFSKQKKSFKFQKQSQIWR